MEVHAAVHMHSLFTDRYSSDQNIPNPFSASTEINYNLKEDNYVSLKIKDLAGRQVALLVNGFQSCGHYSVTWEGLDAGGRQVPDGIYFYTLEAGVYSTTCKMVKRGQ
jgi:flagellar hook assembly protein FlgD